MVSSTLLVLNDKRCLNFPESQKKLHLKDFSWIVDLTCGKQDDVPILGVLNACQTSKKQNTLQKVWYLPQINASTTSISVLHATIKFAQKISKKCSKKAISVTYNLPITKFSIQLQKSESTFTESTCSQIWRTFILSWDHTSYKKLG